MDSSSGIARDDPRSREAKRILKLVGDDPVRAFDVVERQLSVLALRTQVMLSLSGIVITVTGFSGRAIAETSASARLCIASGIVVVLASAAVAISGVLRIEWLTQAIADDPVETLVRGLVLRDRKSRHLAASLVLFVVGFALYVVAIAQLLLAAVPPG